MVLMNTIPTQNMTETGDTGEDRDRGEGWTTTAAGVAIIIAIGVATSAGRDGGADHTTRAEPPHHCNPQEFFRWADQQSRDHPETVQMQVHLFTPAGEELWRMHSEGEITAADARTAAEHRKNAEMRLMSPGVQ